MKKLAETKGKLKRKELTQVTDVIEQYHFYFTNLVIENLIKDQ